MVPKLIALLLLVPLDARAGVVYRDVWYPDGVVRLRNIDVANFAPGVVDRVVAFFREHTPIDLRPATEGEPNLWLRTIGGWGWAMAPGYFDPTWPDAAKTLLFERDGNQDDETLAHEVMHALGFAHEQQRPDRESWIDTCFNVDPFNYGVVGPAPYALTSPYDYASIMHYETPCVTPTQPAQMNPRYRGRATLMSVHDINSLYRVYGRALGATHPGDDFGHAAAHGDFDDDGFSDVALASAETWGRYRRLWVYFYKGAATESGELVHAPWFREVVDVAWTSKARLELVSADLNGDGIADLAARTGSRARALIVNVPDDGSGIAPWGKRGITAIRTLDRGAASDLFGARPEARPEHLTQETVGDLRPTNL